MRIFQVMAPNASTLVPTNETWIRNLHEPLVDLGHDVVLFRAPSTLLDPGDGRRNRQARFSARLLEAFVREHARRPVDLFFAYLTDHMVDPQVIDEIRRRGVPT